MRALITGASAGIGEAFARLLAERGYDLILAARRRERLEQLAQELTMLHQIDTTVISEDVVSNDFLHAVAAAQNERPIDVLINNAGFGTYGALAMLEEERELHMIDVNVRAVYRLIRSVLPDMIKRNSGAIINVASTVAFQPVPYMTTYASCKAFVLSLTEGLAEELKPHGIRMLAVCPGATKTEFFTVAQAEQLIGKKPIMTPEAVAKGSLQALERGKVVYVPGAVNRAICFLVRFFPRQFIRKIGAKWVKGNN